MSAFLVAHRQLPAGFGQLKGNGKVLFLFAIRFLFFCLLFFCLLFFCLLFFRLFFFRLFFLRFAGQGHDLERGCDGEQTR